MSFNPQDNPIYKAVVEATPDEAEQFILSLIVGVEQSMVDGTVSEEIIMHHNMPINEGMSIENVVAAKIWATVVGIAAIDDVVELEG